MTTNYGLSDTLPKDAGGAKFGAWVNDQTSQLDFSLPKGICTSTIGSKLLGHLAIGSHGQSSVIEALHPLVAVGGVYTDYATTQTSPVSSGRAKMAHMSNWGELYATPYPPTASIFTAGSRNTAKTSSGIVLSFGVSWSDANTGNVVTLKNNTTDVISIVFTATSGNVDRRIPTGGIPLSTCITIDRTVTGGGGASVFVSFL